MKWKTTINHSFALATCVSIICAAFTFSHLHAENRGNYQTEKLKAALIDLMDKVMESPDNGSNWKKINITAKMLIKEENKEINRHRLTLLEKITSIKNEKEKIKKKRKSDIRRWLKSGKKVRRGFSKMSEIENNIDLYKNFLLITPLYSGMTKIFDEKNLDIKKHFRLYMKKKYSFWLPKKEKVSPKDIATVMFAHKSDINDTDLYINPNFAQRTIAKTQEINEIESELKNKLIDLDEMLIFFLYAKYSNCIEMAEKILEYDNSNPEASFYRKRAEIHLNKGNEYERTDLSASRPSAPESRMEILNEAPKAEEKIKARKVSKKTPRKKPELNLIKRPAKKHPVKTSATVKKTAKKTLARKRIIPAPKPTPIKNKKENLTKSVVKQKKLQAPKKMAKNNIVKKARDYYVLGIKHYALGNMEKAEEYFKKCVKINPGHIKAKKALGRILKEKNQNP